ncbi:transcriptional regulator [Ochrobactrum sp. 695/2009]|uniref:Helix-turn-helix transcriptional regulator n=1 Tax=Brucella intermedia TaxID=94625 RepID=A0A7V6U066_9HYPH|nr:helix-turn-helix transcriptional regulator [Brucella intermedia]PJR92404.1 transcriptional regulator [Ochrobactrum sp. 721/2009]PJT15772.1 transcriptional regulator [Ochrobactrum sp. 720/2009]PJT18368.1 transcriptional regulator [Ochrobactrum sp. 715/2009]PJT24010.1 transcriptional regulator [Ochrobactrum sp. 695/2009]PJT33541.1 transcriptional regulator [Ochrobactrum sp. 689/2009]
MENRDIFARNLFWLRDARKLSQEELGFRAGLHRSTIQNFENRKHSPTLKNLAKLAAALDVTIDELISPRKED